MRRISNTLAVALVAASALTLMNASSASAAVRLTPVGSYPLAWVGEQTGIFNELVLEGSRKLRCGKATFSGTQSESEATTFSWTASVTPTYSECTAEILGNVTPATVTMNGCTYTFTLTGIYINATEATGSMDIKCPVGKSIEIHVWQTSAKHTSNGTALCTYSIGAQSLLGPLNYSLSGPGERPHTYLTVEMNIAGLSVSKTSGTITNCGSASQTAKLESDLKFEFQNGGVMTDTLFVSEP